MHAPRPEFEQIAAVLRDEQPEQALTAREILALLKERGKEFESAHRIATILGRGAQFGEIEVIQASPYRYQVHQT